MAARELAFLCTSKEWLSQNSYTLAYNKPNKDGPLSQYKAIKHESMKLKPVTPLNGLTLSDKLACLSAQALSANKAVCEQGLSVPDWHFVNTILAFHLTPETEGLLCCFMVVNGLFELLFF